MTTGEKIRLFRVFSGMNQEEFGFLVGATQRMVVMYEQNKFQPPVNVINVFCNFFSLNPEWVINNTHPVFSSPLVGYSISFSESILKDAGLFTRKRNELINVIFDLLIEKFLKELNVKELFRISHSLKKTNEIGMFKINETLLFLEINTKLEIEFFDILKEGYDFKISDIFISKEIPPDLENITKFVLRKIKIFDNEKLINQFKEETQRRKIEKGKILHTAKIKEVCKLIEKYKLNIEDVINYLREKSPNRRSAL